jgi:hypothetical protein
MSGLMYRHMVLLSCALLAASGTVAAAPGSAARKSSGTTEKTSAPDSDHWRQDLESWLARLRGSFTIRYSTEDKIGNCRSAGAGLQECSRQMGVKYVSAATCSGVGAGPGVLCTFEELRPESSGNGAGGVGASLLSSSNDLPGRLLFGIDPLARKISVMIVDPGSAGYGALGTLAGDDATFNGRCDIPGSSYRCTWIFSIHAPPDGQRILIKRVRPNHTGVSSDSLLLSGLNDPRTFELKRVE